MPDSGNINPEDPWYSCYINEEEKERAKEESAIRKVRGLKEAPPEGWRTRAFLPPNVTLNRVSSMIETPGNWELIENHSHVSPNRNLFGYGQAT